MTWKDKNYICQLYPGQDEHDGPCGHHPLLHVFGLVRFLEYQPNQKPLEKKSKNYQTGLESMQMINKAGNMIRLVCIPAFLTFMQKSFSTDQDSQNPSRLQDDPSLLWSSKPPVHGSTGLERTGSDPCPRQHCPSHVLQPSLRF